jgi:hypothetical protein
MASPSNERAPQPARPDRAALAYERVEGSSSSIWVARGDGSHALRVARRGYAPSLSPNGRWLTYALPSPGGGRGAVRLVDVAHGDSRAIGNVGVAWSPDSRRLAMVNDAGIAILDLRSRRRRMLVRMQNLSLGSFDSGGTSLTYARSNGEVGRAFRSDIFIVRLTDARIVRLTHDGHSDEPTWGGGWIAYRSYRFSGEWSIGSVRVIRPNRTGDRLIARGHDNVGNAEQGIEPVGLSADGRHLAACLAFEFGCPPAAFTVPNGRRVRLSFRREARTLAHPNAISRDGKAMLVSVEPFESNAGYRVYVVPFGRGKTRLLLSGARSPSWAR